MEKSKFPKKKPFYVFVLLLLGWKKRCDLGYISVHRWDRTGATNSMPPWALRSPQDQLTVSVTVMVTNSKPPYLTDHHTITETIDTQWLRKMQHPNLYVSKISFVLFRHIFFFDNEGLNNKFSKKVYYVYWIICPETGKRLVFNGSVMKLFFRHKHILLFLINEPAHEKNGIVRSAKTQLSLRIWSESLFCALWVALDLRCLHANSKDYDQTARIRMLIWVFTGRTYHFVCFSCTGSNWLSPIAHI